MGFVGNLKKLFKTLVCTYMIGYLSYHFVSGENGVLTYYREKTKLDRISLELKLVEHKKITLANKVNMLYPKNLDRDLLDEQVRRATGTIKTNEMIYYYEN